MPQDSGDAFALMEMWNEMQQAFKDCGFTDKEKDEMYSVLAGVLHLGNLVFEDGDEGDAAVVQNMDRAETISRILMIDQNRLLPALMTYACSRGCYRACGSAHTCVCIVPRILAVIVRPASCYVTNVGTMRWGVSVWVVLAHHASNGCMSSFTV